MLEFVVYNFFFSKDNKSKHSSSSNYVIFSAASSVRQLVVAVSLCQVLSLQPCELSKTNLVSLKLLITPY